jgi:hypothetical protein
MVNIGVNVIFASVCLKRFIKFATYSLQFLVLVLM